MISVLSFEKIFWFMLVFIIIITCILNAETGKPDKTKEIGCGITENTKELSSSEITLSKEGENTINSSNTNFIRGTFVIINPQGYDGANLIPAILGFGNRDDVEERRWSIFAYSPSNNEFHFMTNNKNQDILNTEYIFHGNVKIMGHVSGENFKVSGNVEAKNVYFSLLRNDMVDIMTDEYKSACKACDFDGRYLYVGMYAEAKASPFRIYDCENPEQPIWVSPKDIGGMPYMNIRSVRHWKNRVYFISLKEGEAILGIIDVTEKDFPKVKSTINLNDKYKIFEAGNFLDIDTTNSIVYVCGLRRIYSIDVKDESNPEIIGEIEVGGINNSLWTVKYLNGYIYTGGRNDTKNTLHIIDVSNPRGMQEITPKFPIDLKEGMWSLDVEENYVYISAGGCFTRTNYPKFYIVNIQDKNNPLIVSSMKLGMGAASYIKKVGDLCYVSTFDSDVDNMYIIDVRKPQEPKVISSGKYGNMILSFYPVYGGEYLYLLFGDVGRIPPFLGLVKQGEFRAGKIKAGGIQIIKGSTLKIGDTEITEEQLKLLLKSLEEKKNN